MILGDVQPRAGQVYVSKRTDIEPVKEKYQLFFDERTVLLINTEKSKRNVSVLLPQKDCPILKYDSYICIDNIFRFEDNIPILEIEDVSTSALKKLKEMVRISNSLTGIQIKHLEQKISMIIANREESI